MQYGGNAFLQQTTKMLLNPGYEYIAAPMSEYADWENYLRNHYGTKVNCNSY